MKTRLALLAATMLAAFSSPCVAQTGAIACAIPSPAPCRVVMTGLDNPRDLAFGPDGELYVSEAGRGGDGPCFFANRQFNCYGPTGAITRFRDGVKEQVVTGLPSMAAPGTGSRAVGPNGLTFHGKGGLGYVVIGWEANPSLRSTMGEVGSYFARLIRFHRNGEWKFVADIGQFEIDNNPVGDTPGGEQDRVDSNPFRMLAEPAGHVVVDAGGNDLLRVSESGQVSLIAVFPAIPQRSMDSVPTSVVVGPDGAYYVSELTGFPFPLKGARIYRVVPGADPEIFLSGFRTLIDMAFNEAGDLYVLEHSLAGNFGSPGAVTRVNLAGCTTAPDSCSRTLIRKGLRRPTSLQLGPEGEVYVTVNALQSDNGVDSDAGEVWRIDP